MEEGEIIISPFAVQCLSEIFDFYAEESSEDVADMVLNNILEKIESLKINNLGSFEPYFEPKKFVLIYNYKIIFERKGKIIEILDIFHTSQDPLKIPKRTKSEK